GGCGGGRRRGDRRRAAAGRAARRGARRVRGRHQADRGAHMSTTVDPQVRDITKVFLVATEESGDRLGAALMQALRQQTGRTLAFEGLGGAALGGRGGAGLVSHDRHGGGGFGPIPPGPARLPWASLPRGGGAGAAPAARA